MTEATATESSSSGLAPERSGELSALSVKSFCILEPSGDQGQANKAAEPEVQDVQFLGGLPAFLRFGNCGAHPQFEHTKVSPPGYRFVSAYTPISQEDEDKKKPPTDPALPLKLVGRAFTGLFRSAFAFIANIFNYGLIRCLSILLLMARLACVMVARTGRVVATLRFLHSRHYRSQVMAPKEADLVFLTSVPFTVGQNPWVIEIEDATTLFFPYISNGETSKIDIHRNPYHKLVKILLESPQCRGIVTHMRSTAQSIPALFQSDIITSKVTYAPLGVAIPSVYQKHEESDTVNLLFTNSWHQHSVGFFLRGGLDVLVAMDQLHEKYPNLRLTLRSRLPTLHERYHDILEKCWVRVIDRFVPKKRMAELQAESHIYLLPSARIHIVSLLQAMSYGQAVIVSDGWGMDEYVENGRNGLIVPGRGGEVSWMDEKTGLLREDYRPMYDPNPVVVEGIVKAVSRLMDDPALRKRLGQTARADVIERYNTETWNRALKQAFDKARRMGA